MVIVLCCSRKFKWHKKAFGLRLPFHQNTLILVCPLLILRRNVLMSHLYPLPNLSLSLNSRISRNLSRKVEKVKIEEHERVFFVRKQFKLFGSLRYQRRTYWRQLTKYPTVDERTELSRDVLQKAILNIEK
ncbi:uncharacterized protein LOC111086559 isoform X2 [Limulus polyphemus]|uniref:Uncharacterized protein LOC111086559 isoform X2 n=1 Tax=Limulus polyphemus TaxID=6850 RepID=A0ABM1SPI3_LIMPO|nr:uncharacterized protein LOC111086559 isoform X2 [Limulus polyphemus]